MTALWWLPDAAAVPPLEFKTPPSFPVGDGPWQIVAADLNGDGLTDLVTANFDDNTVSVLLGQGLGAFDGARHFAVGSHPDSLAVADLNVDGKPDVVTANGNGWNQPGTLSVLLGRGDGTFEAATHLTVDRGPRGVAVADYNHDGKPDIATAISGGWFETNRVNVLFGRGDGAFDPPTGYTVGTAPAWIACADFNRDGHPDLVTANAGPGASGTTVGVLLNNGDGTFAAAVPYPVGTYPGFVTVADFNHDDSPDLAVANRSSPSVSVLLGRANGTFGAATALAIPSGVSQGAVGDFDGDHNPDLAALGGNYDSGAVTVLLGNGAGSFGAPVAFSIGADLQAIATGDFNQDGSLDLVVAGGYDNAVLFMPGKGDGSFQSVTDTYPVGGSIFGIITSDFNRDNQLDLAAVNYDSNSVSVLIQQTNGLFLAATNYPVGAQPHAVKAGDFNNDGRLDLVTANFDGTLTLLRGRTSVPGAFANDWPAMTIGSNHTDVAVGFFNSGSHLDIVTPNYYGASLSVALGVGDGTFHSPPPPALSVNNGPTCVVVDDFNGDGRSDIAVGYEGGFKISILTGRGDGTFEPTVDIDTWEIPWFNVTGDFNFDGKPDLAAAHYDWRRVSVMINRGTNGGPITFDPPVMHEVANDPVSVAVGDFNGDNLPDLVSGNFASLSVLLGLGDGTFTTATNYFVGGKYAAVGDFNGDSMPDIAIDLGGKVGLFWNQTLPRLQIRSTGSDVRIAWPAWKGYEIEANATVAGGSLWTPLTNAQPATFGSQYVLTNSPSSGQQVFRLKRK